ncbi:MAG TPA: ribosome maturation factor RimM [Xanthobacteraceae bacterium]|nr:ribosome maturation factor RimM [Xanthobacteraceae bacterium]
MRRVCVAKIGAAHGLRGEVRLFSFTREPMAVRGYGPFEDESGERSLVLEALRNAGDHLVARFEGVNDRDAARALTNVSLYVPRARLPEPEAESFYHADLIGLRVQAKDGRALGTVAAVQDYGAGGILEIAPASGGEAVMLPFVEAFVPEVDLQAGVIVVDPPAGIFAGEQADEGR